MSAEAKMYDKAQLSHQSDDGLRSLVDQLSPLTGDYVLDLGCGMGFLANVIAERVGPDGKVTAVDPNNERLKIVRQRYKAQSNIEFLDRSSETFPSGPYDAIVSNHVMHWIKDKESAFQKVHDNLKRGGRFGFVCSENTWELLNAKVRESFHMWSGDVYERTALKCGFEVEFKSVAVAHYALADVKEYGFFPQ